MLPRKAIPDLEYIIARDWRVIARELRPQISHLKDIMTKDDAAPLTDDHALVRRFQAGDQSAFDELGAIHRPALVQLVRKYVKRESDAEDVVQQCLVRAYKGLATFRGEASLKSWLYRIAVHAALNFVRGLPKEQSLEVDDVAAFTSSLDTSKLVASEVWQKVAAMIIVLPPKQRLVLELRLFHDLSFAEVAAIADCSEDAAKVNFHHAVKRLRSSLPEDP